MMASSDLDRVHERLDEICAFVGRMQAVLDVNIALCKDCRPKVMGNGQQSLDNRLTRLEEARAVSKTFLVGNGQRGRRRRITGCRRAEALGSLSRIGHSEPSEESCMTSDEILCCAQQ